MTRLATADVRSISAGLAGYESELSAKTGYSLRGIACQAADVNEEEIKDSLKNALIGVIPITGGLGIIGGFSDAVAGIVAHMGCKTFITQAIDVAGLAEAFEQKADIILLADDHRFIALHTATGLLIDNAAATPAAYPWLCMSRCILTMAAASLYILMPRPVTKMPSKPLGNKQRYGV